MKETQVLRSDVLLLVLPTMSDFHISNYSSKRSYYNVRIPILVFSSYDTSHVNLIPLTLYTYGDTCSQFTCRFSVLFVI